MTTKEFNEKCFEIKALGKTGCTLFSEEYYVDSENFYISGYNGYLEFLTYRGKSYVREKGKISEIPWDKIIEKM